MESRLFSRPRQQGPRPNQDIRAPGPRQWGSETKPRPRHQGPEPRPRQGGPETKPRPRQQGPRPNQDIRVPRLSRDSGVLRPSRDRDIRVLSRDREREVPRPSRDRDSEVPRPRHLQNVSRPSRDILKPVTRLPRAETPVSGTPSQHCLISFYVFFSVVMLFNSSSTIIVPHQLVLWSFSLAIFVDSMCYIYIYNCIVFHTMHCNGVMSVSARYSEGPLFRRSAIPKVR